MSNCGEWWEGTRDTGVAEILKVTKMVAKIDENKFSNLLLSSVNDSTILSSICCQFVGKNYKNNSSPTQLWNETSGGEIL